MKPRRKRSTKPRSSYLLGFTMTTRREVTDRLISMVSRLHRLPSGKLSRGCHMNQTLLIALIVVAVVVAALLVLGAMKRRSRDLKQHFGPEYDRLLREKGDARKAEAELAAREKRVKKLELRDLPAAERQRFSDAWTALQARFVDDPKGAVSEANRLVKEVMTARGYPVADFAPEGTESFRSEWSQIQIGFVDEPRQAVERADALVARLMKRLAEVFANERSELERQWDRGDRISTEDLRVALTKYRSFFDRLLSI